MRHVNQAKILERLYHLMQKGYRPDLHTPFEGAIWLHHPTKNYKHNLLLLHADGCVKSARKSDEYRLDEELEFEGFLRSVPQPTLWDKTREWRANVAVWVVIGLVLIGGGLLAFAAQAFYRSL